MDLVRHPAPGDVRLARTVLTLGNFDGVHLGHQAIVARTIAAARALGARAGLLTFQPHPATVLAPAKAPPLILSVRAKLELLGETGIDFVCVTRFSRTFSRLTPEEFIRGYVHPRFGPAAMVVGHSVSFGRNRAGNATVLAEFGARLGFPVEVVEPVSANGVQVSSTAVRAALLRGDVAGACQLLGRHHFLSARVGHGARRGRELGFPTANLLAPGGLVPLDGVYAVFVAVDDATHGGVANVGRNPTFEGTRRGVEVHLLDYTGDLYGRRLRVAFVERLRGEVRFPSAAALARQIAQDAEQARAILARCRATSSAASGAG
jgi:riboflavin kinase/FMN adenylyltransferase